jgi:hypothetical protein
VTFLPYIGGNFIKEYIIPNYVGESLAALIPSTLSLIQGLGQNPGCRNVTNGNVTELEPIPIVPNYSVQLYFIFMFLLLCISTTAFTFLHFSPIAVRQRKRDSISQNEGMQKRAAISPVFTPNAMSNKKNNNNNKLMEIEVAEYHSSESVNSLTALEPRQHVYSTDTRSERNEKIILLSLILGLSFVSFFFLARNVHFKLKLVIILTLRHVTAFCPAFSLTALYHMVTKI